MTASDQGRLTGMGGHQSAAMLKDEWLTPPEIIDALGGWSSFDLDPCAPIERPWPTACVHYTILDNGLMKQWDIKARTRIWFNPPYGGPTIVGPWMRRLAHPRLGTCLSLPRTR